MTSWSNGLAQALEVSVDPPISADGSYVRVKVRLERDPDNRGLVIEVESTDFYRRSEIWLDGDAAASVHHLELRSLSSGMYYARAVVHQGDDRIVSAPIQFQVIGPAASSG